ncbi:hypothetical protein [Synechococcus sp. MU1617]|uniref:hypothetical protein n=1 Tax=Synechococcus sp. MU1617 TaxID=2508346 RepID=UPI001CF8ACF2|nr:hypothetical protein [Synechococcus sp. MU1617]MCB4389364.1 hypothetical protein [Synechococcus sp. MU1617]
MDADFEQHYQAAERAYGLGEYAEAHALTSALWDQLQSATDEHDPSLVLGWRAVVSLLLGHIQLHGLQQPEEASFSYQQVLEGEPDATIAALAEQGLERCRSGQISSEAGRTLATDGAIPDLLKDPFLSTNSDQAKPALADVVTAMPWLSSADKPRAMPTPNTTPTSAPFPSPEPTLTPGANSDVEMANQEPEPTIEEPPLDAVEPTPQEPAATDLLEKSWLRVQLQPAIKSPTDSNEPMGLINRIKEAIARSAGR